MKRDPNVKKNPVVEGHRGAGSALLRHLGATRIGVWVIKHLVSPLDRWIYRRTGRDRTTPVFYLLDGKRLVVCNVNPGFVSTPA